ncbi:MAG: hypothetical protein Q8Q80_09910 [Methyloversatilis sp.]|nr:hypothetical protein [Methyloversatilis sp.]MDP3872969.1 hypothetical protein [Methyloversatilis sp.]
MAVMMAIQSWVCSPDEGIEEDPGLADSLLIYFDPVIPEVPG